MRKIAFVVAVLAALSALAADKVTPLNVKLGLWQTSSSVAINGFTLPPEMLAKLTPEQRAKFEAAMKEEAAKNNGTARKETHKSCLKQNDLTTDPFSRKEYQCTRKLLSSTSSDLEVQEKCLVEGMNMDVHVKLHAVDSEHVKANMDFVGTTSDGHKMSSNGTMDSKWINSSCPADVD